jgi:hypothetical protein
MCEREEVMVMMMMTKIYSLILIGWVYVDDNDEVGIGVSRINMILLSSRSL